MMLRSILVALTVLQAETFVYGPLAQRTGPQKSSHATSDGFSHSTRGFVQNVYLRRIGTSIHRNPHVIKMNAEQDEIMSESGNVEEEGTAIHSEARIGNTNSTITLLNRARSLPKWTTRFLSADDERIVNFAVPAIINNMITPLVGAVDTFWVGRLGIALALAGQSASNQVFTTTFWIISFMPSVIMPMIAKANARQDQKEVQRLIGEAIFVSCVTGTLGMALLVIVPDIMLKLVLPVGAPAREFAKPYLVARGLSYIPAVASSVAFSAFRGVQDVVTPLKISAYTQIINLVLDPLLIFTMGWGVTGAGLATAAAEIAAFITYITLLLKRNLVTWSSMLSGPKWATLLPLLKAGMSVQVRTLILQVAFVTLTRCVQTMDVTGNSAAAHAITTQIWQIAGLILFGFGSAAGVIIPSELVKSKTHAFKIAQKLLRWGGILGVTLGTFQISCIPLVNVLSTSQSVREAARLPSIIASVMQIISGVVFVGEGIMAGYESWTLLALSSLVAATGMLTGLRLFGTSLIGVWGSLFAFNSIRLCFVIWHFLKQKKEVEAENEISRQKSKSRV